MNRIHENLTFLISFHPELSMFSIRLLFGGETAIRTLCLLKFGP